MSKDSNISITPMTAEFEKEGGYYAITTSGSSETWTAAVSDPWIVLNATSGQVGKGCAYTVTASTNVETRTGYVYVSGHVHTVVQAGHGATISPNNVEVECDGGTGTIDITVPGKYGWNARPNVDWLSVTPTHGVGSGSVTYQVAPWHEVSTRSGTLTVAGNTFTVFQYGKRMKLSKYNVSENYEAHVIPVTVDALAITKWSVTPNASWISVVDAGSGQGGDDVGIAIAENPSYKARTGTVTIGTETLTIVQDGRTVLSFAIDPEETTADVYGANGLIAVLATPDLPWTAESQSDWLTIYAKFKTGSGNGNVAYTASPNPTLYDRTGTIKVAPETASGVAAKTHTVTQPAALSSISLTGYEFAAAGENCSVEVTVDDIVEWQVENSASWLSVVGDTTRVGPATITIQAAENTTVYPRSCTITIARKTFSVRQLGRGVTIDTDSFVFGTKSTGSSFTVSPDGNVSWRPVASDDSWIIILDDEERTGSSEVQFVLTQYNGTGEARTGTITVGDKVVYITQRAFDLSINPTGAWVTGNAGAGEIGVSAPIGAVWEAIVTAPWIKVISGYDSGTGSGTVRYTYEDNDTGKARSGKIVISGTAYVLEQAARVMVNIKATAGRGGMVEGGGSYSLGTKVSLRAVPSDGYAFAYWEGDVSSMQNPIEVTADVAKSVTAVFTPLTPEFISVSNSTEGVTLVWSNLAWATEYNLYRAPSQSKSGEPLATIVADGTHEYFDASGEVGVPYWYWVEAVGVADTNECVNAVSGRRLKPIVISSITYANLRGTTHANPSIYEEETSFAFLPPTGTVVGYTFAGWTPSGITEDTTGDVLVTANWVANGYSVVFHANGGSGTMANQAFVYDQSQTLTSNAFVRSGHAFKGWAMTDNGTVAYADGASVGNLTATANGVIELYAVWEQMGGGETPPGGDPVAHDPPAWSAVAKGDSMAVYAVVRDKKSGLNVESGGSLLAAFDVNGECRGVTEIEEGPMGKVFQLSVGIESTGEKGFALKIWDASTGEITEVANAFDANSTKQIGEIFAPVVYEIGALAQTAMLNEGWTWISFSLTPENAKVGALLAGRTFSNGDMLKAIDKIVSYYNGAWYPSTYELKPGAAYMVKKSSGGSETIEVDGTAMSDGITLAAGWNWFGPTTLATQTVSSVSHTGGFANGDQVKGVSKMATWYGGKWYASDFQLCPGIGYVAKFANAGALYFGETPAAPLAVAPRQSMARMSLMSTGSTKPDWKPVAKGDSMAVYAVVHDLTSDADLETEGTILAAFDVNGECRGVTEIEDGPLGKVFQLPVGLESTTETGFVLKLWDPCTQQVLEIVERIDANTDKQIGQIFEPVVYTTSTTPADPITWTYQVSDGKATVSSASPASGDIIIPSMLGGYPVTSIGNRAFDGCSSLTSVTVPSSVMSIGDLAFRDCSGLTNMTIHGGVRSIGVSAFFGCSGLVSVTIPSSVTSIGAYAFYSCSGLTSMAIPKGVTSIGEWAFYECSGLTSVTIPKGVTDIGEMTFYNCSSLTNVTIPDGVTSIGNNAFHGCSGLMSVTMPDSVKSIGSAAFGGCSGLTSVTMPSNVTSIGNSAFSGCSGLTSITIPNGMTSIGNAAFQSCHGLTSVTIPEGVTEIGNSMFYDCSGLTSVTIPSSVTRIHVCAFENCIGLKIVTIPASVARIGEHAFSGCSGLKSMYFKGAPPNDLSDAGIKWSTVIYYNVAYENEWKPVILAWGFTNAKSYDPNDLIPELKNPTTEEVKDVLELATDTKLVAEITNGTDYAVFREWAGQVTDIGGELVGDAGIMAAENVWISFALDSNVLLDEPIADEDLKVEDFKPTAEAGKFEFTVGVEGVEVGSEASKENLKKVFGLEGASELEPARGRAGNEGSGFSADCVDISFDTPFDGKVKFTAGPKDANAQTFFMKVKVK